MDDLVTELREHERNSGSYTPKHLLGRAALAIEQLEARIEGLEKTLVSVAVDVAFQLPASEPEDLETIDRTYLQEEKDDG